MLVYGDKVRIKNGFYKNCYGILVDYEKNGDRFTFEPVYEVEITHIDKNNQIRIKTIKVTEEEIEKLIEGKK